MSLLPYRGISATLQRNADGRVTILEPAHLAGREIVSVDGSLCLNRFESGAICGLISGHRGGCWEMADDIALAQGPFAVVRP